MEGVDDTDDKVEGTFLSTDINSIISSRLGIKKNLRVMNNRNELLSLKFMFFIDVIY
jgi:hypothetical protein